MNGINKTIQRYWCDCVLDMGVRSRTICNVHKVYVSNGTITGIICTGIDELCRIYTDIYVGYRQRLAVHCPGTNGSASYSRIVNIQALICPHSKIWGGDVDPGLYIVRYGLHRVLLLYAPSEAFSVEQEKACKV